MHFFYLGDCETPSVYDPRPESLCAVGDSVHRDILPYLGHVTSLTQT